MNHSAWIDPRLYQLTVAQVTDYLKDHGWAPKPYPRPQLLVFEGPKADDGEPMIQILPASERASDYGMRLEEMLGSLAVIENRRPLAILEEMLGLAQKNGAAHAVADGGVRQP